MLPVSKIIGILFIYSVPGSSIGAMIVTDKSFKSLESKISSNSLEAILEMGFTHMTEIQAKSIPHLLEGRYVGRNKSSQ